MSRLIDADMLTEVLKSNGLKDSLVYMFINQEPTVDAVEVVRCEDCRWSDPMFGICKNPTTVRCEAEINPNDYCPKGERRTE